MAELTDLTDLDLSRNKLAGMRLDAPLAVLTEKLLYCCKAKINECNASFRLSHLCFYILLSLLLLDELGGIPAGLGKLVNLTNLDLHGNVLTGASIYIR